MRSVQITETFYAASCAEWRAWLEANHASKTEIWLIQVRTASSIPCVTYLEAVLEGLCFGWSDGIAKKLDDERRGQRFTPRRPKSNWTELNKERARRLIAEGLMTPAGYAVLPNLDVEAFQIPADILAALQADAEVRANFQAFPDLYKRVRIGFIDEVRKQPDVFQQRLNYFLQQTRRNKQYDQME
jgi:uncharacterized protein YdeI (YjbR/CyaY-like superfamily)